MNVGNNQVYEFVYNSGSHPGTTRQVFVTTSDNGGFGGIELDSLRYKRFLYNHMSGLKQAKAKVVNADQLPNPAMLNTLQQEFKNNKYKTYVFNNVLVALEQADTLSYYQSQYRQEVNFTSKSGKVAIIRPTGVYCGKNTYRELTVDNLQKAVDYLRS